MNSAKRAINKHDNNRSITNSGRISLDNVVKKKWRFSRYEPHF